MCLLLLDDCRLQVQSLDYSEVARFAVLQHTNKHIWGKVARWVLYTVQWNLCIVVALHGTSSLLLSSKFYSNSVHMHLHIYICIESDTATTLSRQATVVVRFYYAIFPLCYLIIIVPSTTAVSPSMCFCLSHNLDSVQCTLCSWQTISIR